MTTISIQDAQAQLPELIHNLSPGDELLIMENDRAVARILATTTRKRSRELGTLRGTVLAMTPDFDAPLEQLRGYMP